MKHSLFIRPLFKEDWKAVKEIYIKGMDTGHATFETQAPKWKRWKNNHILSCSLVAQKHEEIVGFASLSRVSNREVYKGVAEVSVYVATDMKGNGIGKTLLSNLVKLSEQQGIWSLQANIFPENNISINLHQACGFRIVGTKEKIGQRLGVWYDNVLLERRSDIF